jgi:hypothetical protein
MGPLRQAPEGGVCRSTKLKPARRAPGGPPAQRARPAPARSTLAPPTPSLAPASLAPRAVGSVFKQTVTGPVAPRAPSRGRGAGGGGGGVGWGGAARPGRRGGAGVARGGYVGRVREAAPQGARYVQLDTAWGPAAPSSGGGRNPKARGRGGVRGHARGGGSAATGCGLLVQRRATPSVGSTKQCCVAWGEVSKFPAERVGQQVLGSYAVAAGRRPGWGASASCCQGPRPRARRIG